MQTPDKDVMREAAFQLEERAFTLEMRANAELDASMVDGEERRRRAYANATLFRRNAANCREVAAWIHEILADHVTRHAT